MVHGIVRLTSTYVHNLIISKNFIFYAVIPSIQSPITDKISNRSENVTFLCQAVGEPVPNISWYFNGLMINVSDNSSKYMIMSRSFNITTTENTLTVYNVTLSDVGEYGCYALNVIGNDSKSGFLQVNGQYSNPCTYVYGYTSSQLLLMFMCSHIIHASINS